MRLSELAAVVPRAESRGDGGVEIEDLCYDSRVAKPGDLFVAIQGYPYPVRPVVFDGHQFIPDALVNGAAAVAVEKPEFIPTGIPAILVPDSRLALALLSDKLYGHPSGHMAVIGVTGTNGKTTTTHLIRSILEATGQKVGLIGTIHNLIDGQELPVTKTTPEALDLQRLFAQMREVKTDTVVIEVSSIALSLSRVAGVEFKAGVFTNLTQDHLDLHQSMASYRDAKLALFAGQVGLAPAEHAVLNVDDEAGRFYRARGKGRVMTYGLSEGAEVRALDPAIKPSGASFRLRSPAGEFPVALALTGLFNVYNAMAAAATGLALGVPVDAIQRGLARLAGVPGRFETVQAGQDFTVVVDYAHTPDGLENVLQTARRLTRGRLIAVFGCGGDRDRDKRPKMGRIAGEHADYCIVTSDNPRSEDPEAIIAQIVPGLAQAGRRVGEYHTRVDRETAIRDAIGMARPGDVVLIAGKGHETYQIFADRTIHFDDREVAREKVRERLGRDAGEDPVHPG